MPDKKQNPLIGAFRDAAPSPPPDPPATGEKKGAEPVQITMDLKSAGTAPQAKPPEPSKTDVSSKQPPTVKDAPATGKPPEQPKAETTPKAPDTAPLKEAKPEKAPAGDAKAPPDLKSPPADTPKEPLDGKAPTGDTKAAPASKTSDATPPKEPPKDGKSAEVPKSADTSNPKKAPAEKDADTSPKKADSGKATDGKKDKETKEAENPTAEKSDEAGRHRFIPLSKIHDLPGTYVKDQPKADYSAMIQGIKAEGLKEPVILRQREDGEYQLVDGFHRMQAIKKAGMLEVRADVYDMSLKEASDYRRARHSGKPLPIPGKLIPPNAPAQDKATAPPAQEAPKDKAEEAEIPEDFKLPLTHEGQSEIITTLKVSEIHPFEGHPFNVKDDKDMMDLVDSIKKIRRVGACGRHSPSGGRL